jgi:membrane associated rhomboid family serine protease
MGGLATTGLVVVALLLLMLLRRQSERGSWLGRALSGGLGGFVALFSGLVIPLGPSDREVRRQPWVTYGIAGLCVLVFQLQLWLQPGPGWDGEWHAAAAAAVDYAAEHPYLELPPALEEFWGETIRQQAAERPRVRPESPAATAAEQEELERRVDELLEVLDRRPERRWASVPSRASLTTALSSMFVHADWLHLLMNLAFLMISGPFVEDVFGRVLFALLYLGAGMVGDWATAAAGPDSHVASIGASGAIAGVMGAFLVRFTTRRLDFVSLPATWLPVLRARVSVPAYLYLLPWLAMNVVSLHLGRPGVGWHAHIGGFLFGVLFAAVVRLGQVEERLIHPRIEASLSIRQHPAVERAFAQRMAGRPGAALRTAEQALAQSPDELGLLREACDAAVALGDLEVAAAHGARVVALLQPRGDRDSVREGRRFIKDVDAMLDGSPHPRFWWAAAEFLEAHGDAARAMVFFERVAAGPDQRLARQAVARQERLRGLLARAGGASRAGDR